MPFFIKNQSKWIQLERWLTLHKMPFKNIELKKAIPKVKKILTSGNRQKIACKFRKLQKLLLVFTVYTDIKKKLISACRNRFNRVCFAMATIDVYKYIRLLLA